MTFLFGWTPPDNAEYTDVLLSTVQAPTNPRKSNHIASADPGLNIPATLSTSQVEQDQQDDFALVTATGDADPSWVARPRNKFILFRCDYVRKHSRDGKRLRHGLGSETEKSLSKQAAEAWHRLSKEERLYWKECAAGEQIEHAKKYPGYRYRPKKNLMIGRRQARSSNTPVDDCEATSSSKKLPQVINRHRHPQSPSIKQKHRSSSVPHIFVRDSVDPMTGKSNIQNIASQSNYRCTSATRSLPSPLLLQMHMPSASFDTPEWLSPNSFRINCDSSPSASSSLPNWIGENMVHPGCAGSSSSYYDVSMLGLFQNPASNIDLRLEMPLPGDPTYDSAGTNLESVGVPEYITGEMQSPLLPSFFHHQQQQWQQLFDNSLYQPTSGNLCTSYPIEGTQMDITSPQTYLVATDAHGIQYTCGPGFNSLSNTHYQTQP